jgi:hypothetical protein
LKKGPLQVVLVLCLFFTGCQGPASVETATPPIAGETQLPIAGTTEVPLPTATATLPVTLEITVTTDQDIVDGDTSGLTALLAAPGADGVISPREAVEAANLTEGPKRIAFAPALKDATLYLGQAQRYEEPRLLLTADQLSISGDVDGDGISDITLDGSALDPNYSMAFIINASQVTLEYLQFNAFRNFAVAFACVNDVCGQRTYSQIILRNNVITSDVGGGGILLAPLKIVSDMADPRLFSHISISDVQIVGNQISVRNGGNGGIFIMAAGAGGSDNYLSNLLIHGNTIASPGTTITVNAADGSSYYFRFPGEEMFSDRNVVEQVVISSNTLNPEGVGGDSARPAGVVMVAGNFGNSDNTIRDVRIADNTISASAEHMVTLNPTNNDVLGGLPLTTRAATGNAIENVEISGNTSHADSSAFSLLAASGQDPAPRGATGRLSHIWIHDNQILDYKWEGIDIFTGVGESDNLIEDVVIEKNTFTALEITKGQALFVYAGGCSGCTRPSARNQILGLVIRENVVNGNDFAFIYGGMGDYASDNTVEFYLGENTLNPAEARIDVSDFVGMNNSGNRMIRLEQAP